MMTFSAGEHSGIKPGGHGIECHAWFCVIVVGVLLAIAHSATAQVRRVSLRGLVFSTASASPLSATFISVDHGEQSIRSNLNGGFETGPVAPGDHVITFERAGYSSRAFRVVVSDTLTGVFDIGPVELTPVEAPIVQVHGLVADTRTSTPIPQVAIALNAEIVAVSDSAGRFAIDSVLQGNNLLEARRIGYTPWAADLNVAEGARDLSITLALDPLPFRLDDVEVVVDGDRTIYALGRLRDFYRRRRSTPGSFFTREDIERRNPHLVSDMLRTVPGVRISHSTFSRRITVRGCTPVIYLDGMPLRGVQLDDIVFPDDVQAIEVHRGAFLPVEFMTFGSCAAIAIWTR